MESQHELLRVNEVFGRSQLGGTPWSTAIKDAGDGPPVQIPLLSSLVKIQCCLPGEGRRGSRLRRSSSPAACRTAIGRV